MDAKHPRHTWVPYLAGLAGSALLLKATLIIASSNQVDEGPMTLLYLAGLGVGLVAAVGAGLRRTRVLARIGVALGLAVLLAAWITMLSDAVEPLITLFSSTAYVIDEAPVGIAGIAILAAAWFGYTRDQRTAQKQLAHQNA
ncbi:MAG: hypothetical protein ACRDT4_15060 [Micromonosporaceae bacterium]